MSISLDKIKILQPKTLIYVFYNFTEDRDVQVLAARFLYQNRWVYNYKKMLWFQDLEYKDLMNSKTIDSLYVSCLKNSFFVFFKTIFYVFLKVLLTLLGVCLTLTPVSG